MKQKILFLLLATVFSASFLVSPVSAGTTASPLWTRVVYSDADGPVKSIATDSQDNVYVLGEISGVSDFNFNELGSDMGTYSVFKRVFLTRWNADGSYGWTKYLAHTGSHDAAEEVLVDSNDDVIIVGSFQGTVNFNPDGSDPRTSNGGKDVFFSKWSSDGTYRWTHTFGNASNDTLPNIALDGSDNIYVVGGFQGSVNFDDSGSDIHTAQGAYTNTYITSFAAAGSYRWTYTYDGPGNYATAIASDSNGLYVLGGYSGLTEFNPAGTSSQQTAPGGWAVYLQKLNFSGQQQWFREFGDGNVAEYNLQVKNATIAIGGIFSGDTSFGPSGADAKTLAGFSDAFVSTWDTSGSYKWTNTFGNYDAIVYNVGIDANGGVYGVGYFAGTDVNFDPNGSALFSSVSDSDFANFVVRYNSDGTYDWTKASTGTSGISENMALHFDSAGNLLLGGSINCAPTGCYPIPGDSSAYDTAYSQAPYVTKWQVTAPKQLIVHPPSGTTIVTKEGVDVVSQGIATSGDVWLTVKDLSGRPIVDINVDMSTDRDWSSVQVGTDESTGKAFVTGLTGSGAVGTHSLYIPKLPGQNGVFICPDATNYEEVFENCSNAIRYSADNPHVQVVHMAGKNYWLVDGLTGTGGSGMVLAASTTLEDTGTQLASATVVSATVITAAFVVILSRKRVHYILKG